MTVKVCKLRKILQDAIDYIDEEMITPNDEVELVGNTYFLKGAKFFLGISGFNGGYVDLENIEIIPKDEED